MRLAVVMSAALFASACYNPQIGEGKFLCGPGCPSGFVCAADNRCYRTPPSIDMLATGFVGNGALGNLDLSNQPGATILFNGKTGVFKLAAAPNTVLVGPGMNSGFATGFQPMMAQSGGPPVSIWNFGKVIVPSGVTLQSDPAAGAGYAVAFVANEQLTLQGTIDVTGIGGFGGLPGKGGKDPNSTSMSGGGGGAGSADGSGGGGGGHKDPGKAGMGTSGGLSGMAFGSDDLTTLAVGTGGGGGSASTTVGSRGGAGGGGIALISTALDIAGKIDASGAAGEAGDSAAASPAGGGGGGSGGAILLGGGSVTIEVTHTFLAKGGLGAAGSVGGVSGGDGSVGRITVTGTTVTNGGTSNDSPIPTIKNGSTITSFPR